VYVKQGLEGKTFDRPQLAVVLDQKGCRFVPRVLGIQAGQTFKVTNSDPVTHNVHPIAKMNREWNQSQSPDDPPLERRFARPEVMVRVKCNVHSWMRSWVGVLDHPYFAITGPDGSYEINNLPPGEYTLEAWHETLGTQEQKVKVDAQGKASAMFRFDGGRQ
jgi:plastocyanin